MQNEWRGTLNLDEVFKGMFLKGSDLNGMEKEITFTGEARVLEFEENGQTKKKLGVKLVGEEQEMVMNVTNRKLVQNAYGGDTDKWQGKIAILYPEAMNVNGRIQDVIKLRIPLAKATDDVEEEEGF